MSRHGAASGAITPKCESFFADTKGNTTSPVGGLIRGKQAEAMGDWAMVEGKRIGIKNGSGSVPIA